MHAPHAGEPDSKAVLIPNVVRRILGEHEEVEVRYELKGAEVYATPTRLIIIRDEQTSAHEYRQIAAAREIGRSNVWLILCGVAFFALGGTSAIFPVVGAALLLLGIFTRARRVELLLTGIKEPVVLDGAREVLVPFVQRLVEKGARRLVG